MKKFPYLLGGKTSPAEPVCKFSKFILSPSFKVAFFQVYSIFHGKLRHRLVHTIVLKVFLNVVLASGICSDCRYDILKAPLVEFCHRFIIQEVMNKDNPVRQLRRLFRRQPIKQLSLAGIIQGNTVIIVILKPGQ